MKQIVSYGHGTRKVLTGKDCFASEKALESVVTDLRCFVGLPSRIREIVAKSSFTDEEIREIYVCHSQLLVMHQQK